MKSGKAVYVGSREREGALTSEEYAEESELNSMMAMLTRISLRRNNVSGQQVLAEFVSQSAKGENVLLKTFGNFSKTALERMCFLHHFTQVFDIDNARNGLDYLQLFKLLCSDFPQEIILRAVQTMHPKPEISRQAILHLPLDGKLFLSSIYINFVYMGYVGELQQAGINTLDRLAEWVLSADRRMEKYFEKPPFGIAAQCVVTLINKRCPSLHSMGLVLVTEHSFQAFAQEHGCTDRVEINANEYLNHLLHDSEHQLLIRNHTSMFQALPQEMAEIQRILSQRDPCQTPSNIKKNTKNKK